jgi:hypothetical protein
MALVQKPTGPSPEDTIEINMGVSLEELYMLEPNVTLSTPVIIHDLCQRWGFLQSARSISG